MSVNTKMTAIADEIRTLSGTTVAMGLDAMATNIGNANSEIDSQADLLSQIVTALEGKTAVKDTTLPTLTNEGSASDLLAGKQLINSNNEVVTGTIPTQAAQTITPGTSNKTIASGRYLTGTQTIKGDANLVAGNIKSGVSIFGVAGTFEGSGGGSGGGSELLYEKATLENMGMFEPGMDEYTVTSPNLNLPTRRMVGVMCETNNNSYSHFYSAFMIYRNNTSESFVEAFGDDYGSGFSSSRLVINENSFTLYGSPLADDYYIVAI